MARETKAQREEREKAERIAFEEEVIAMYPERLMSALERACKHGWDLTVEEGQFVVSYYDSYNDREQVRLPPSMTVYNPFSDIDDLERELQAADDREAEYKRKQAIRQAAYAKLTPEEREELGIKHAGY